MSTQMRHLALFAWISLCFIMLDWVSVAQGYQDYQTWNLPDGAIARFGKGGISQGDRVIAFSPDGGLLAVATTIGVWLYDVRTTRELALFPVKSRWNHAVAFSPGGTKLAAGAGNQVKLWDIATRTNDLTLEGSAGLVWSVAFSPDSTLLASGSSDKTVKLWEVLTGANISTLTGHTDRVRSVSFSPEGNRLATGSADKSVKLWDVKTGANIDTLASTNNPMSAKQVIRSIMRGDQFWAACV